MSDKSVNFEVIKRDNESEERLIKRFIKKSSKNEILQEFLEKRFFVSESEKNRTKRRKKAYLSRKNKE